MNTKLKLCVDLGSSLNKGINLTTNDRLELANCIIPVQDSVDLSDYYNVNDVDSCIDITINKILGDSIKLTLPVAGVSQEFAEVMSNRYVSGELAKNYSSAQLILPSSSKPKVFQQTTYVNLISVIVSQMLKSGIDSTDLVLGLMLPPREYLDKELKGLFIKNIAGTYNIRVNSLGKVLTFQIDEKDIYLMSECSAALATFIFNIDGTMRQEAEKYSEGIVLAIDGGRSTTDLALINEHKLVTGSYATIPMGGELVIDLLCKKLADKYRMPRPSDINLERAVRTGFIKQGARKIDISDVLIEAKKEYARNLYNGITGYLNTQRITATSIEALLYIGGLFMECEHPNVPSTATYVSEMFKQLSLYTAEEHIENPRYANLEGICRMIIANS